MSSRFRIRLKIAPFKWKRPLTEEEKAWRILRICKSGKDPHMTADNPKVVKAAEVVGVTKAISFLKRKRVRRDIMDRSRRQPGSFGSRQ